MRILMVSSYPPVPCGIGAYAEQHVGSLRADGHIVDVLGHPAKGPDGDFTEDLRSGWRLLRLLRYLWAYDRVVVQYTPDFFYSSDNAADRLRTSLAFLLLCILFGRRMKIVVHETEFRLTESPRRSGLRKLIDRWTWRLCRLVVFHSERERDAFAAHYRLNPQRPQFQVVAHDRHFRPRAQGTRDEARRLLSLPEDKTLLLCIGFVQPHKGFDRLLRAMRHVPSDAIVARIVGSVRINWQPALDYARELHRLCDEDPRTAFVEKFATDEEFDRWIIASDYVVVPYHEIWSSGVAARAKLHQRPVISSKAGALLEQLPEGSLTFETEQDLTDHIRTIANAAR